LNISNAVSPRSRHPDLLHLEDDPLWYKDAVIYELHVRAFHDSKGDGYGDFRGLTDKLDYLQDLGVTALWLLPFYPSPLKDDGYDIAAYTDVHPHYGALQDFRTLMREAHRRGLRVITELVINHTSDQHAWFQRARRANPGSRYRDFYVWSDTPDRYNDTRVIFKDFESSNWSWDPVAQAYYWHRFYHHQPDLNFDNAQVRKAVFQLLDFWLGMGVDGLRLDAVPYLFEREGTTNENLPETHSFLKRLRRHVDQNFRNRMLLAEANMWPEDAAAYFGKGDECHMAFHFPVMPRLFMGIRMEDRFPIIDILQQTPEIPETAQWALFLRNHDELTLEMVTDEDRDYMYRTYAHDPRARINLGIRRRLAPLLNNDRRRIELMNGLLFSLPGTPVIYYGDEIGMGDNIYLGDRNSVRTPMQWSSDRNAGFSRANPQRLYLPVIIDPEYHFEAINVEAQQNNSQSLLWWTKRMIALRKRHKAFGHGNIEFLSPDNRKVLAFVRSHASDVILVVANLSRFMQAAELDLSRFGGRVPVELFGRTALPTITDHPYFITLAPHALYWFALRAEPTMELESPGPAAVSEAGAHEQPSPLLVARGSWQNVLRANNRAELERIVGRHLRSRRWFRGKARTVVETTIVDSIPFPGTYEGEVLVTLVQVEYTEGEPETYVLPIAFAGEDQVEQVKEDLPHALLTRLRVRHRGDAHEDGMLYDPFGDGPFSLALLEAIGKRRRFRGTEGSLVAAPTRAYRRILAGGDGSVAPNLLRGEQTNTSVSYGDRFMLKLFRRIEEGLNPDLEVGRYLTERAQFANIPPVAGSIEYRRGRAEPMTVAMLQGYVPNEGDAWAYTLDVLDRYYERVLADRIEVPLDRGRPRPLLELAAEELPEFVDHALSGFLPSVQLLGLRTGEMHLALGSGEEPAFAAEPFNPHYQRSLYQSARSLSRQAFETLRRGLDRLSDEDRENAQRVLTQEDRVVSDLRLLLDRPLSALRIRCHMDYHLGQVLHTGKDFVIIDFEGEPARPLSQRRMKRSPLLDVAGMLRSFHYAALTSLMQGGVRPEDRAELDPWAGFWYQWVSVAFLQSYLEAVTDARWLPRTREELGGLLNFFLLEKAVYELKYELNNRPDWVGVPLRGILQLLAEEEGARAG
jgi:maltose alpha-D-glucosyltransferase / alpha-amylase